VSDDPIVIVGAKRTPQGSMLGAYRDVPAPHLAGTALRAAIAESGCKPALIDEIMMGCVLPAGLGQAPARQAGFYADLCEHTAATTINKMCGSGMQSIILGHDRLIANSSRIVAVGGMENMTRAPYLLPKARTGYRLGHGQCYDHMFLDGLEDAYDSGKLMGCFADGAALRHNISRDDQDAFAIESLTRAKAAQASGAVANELAIVKEGKVELDHDEGLDLAKPEKIPRLKPVFTDTGTVTAANASSIADGGSALILMRKSTAESHNLTPLATIRGHAVDARAPAEFTDAPAFAIQKLLDNIGWQVNDVDLFEINEAFAVVALIAMRALDIPHEKLNCRGGACAIGHPVGSTGSRIVVTLLAALRERGLKRGVASLCIGGGEATAIAIECEGK